MTLPVREIPFARPAITDDDRKAVLQVLEGHILTHGPECKAFERDFASFLGDEANCVSVSSCMAALHLAYLQFGIGEGDEVIVPGFTCLAVPLPILEANVESWTKARRTSESSP